LRWRAIGREDFGAVEDVSVERRESKKGVLKALRALRGPVLT
jgi:hypothetical protein